MTSHRDESDRFQECGRKRAYSPPQSRVSHTVVRRSNTRQAFDRQAIHPRVEHFVSRFGFSGFTCYRIQPDPKSPPHESRKTAKICYLLNALKTKPVNESWADLRNLRTSSESLNLLTEVPSQWGCFQGLSRMFQSTEYI